MKTYICSLVVTILVSSACDSGTRLTSPASPGPTPSSPTVYTLSGVVTEMTPSGPRPVEGVWVMDNFQKTATDDGGLYTLTYTLARPVTITHFMTTLKAGYETVNSVVAVNADTRLDFQLSRIVAPTLSGVVFEVTAGGRLPIAGVQLYCEGCGLPLGHTFTHTDANGQYRFEWTPNGDWLLWVDKQGYALVGDKPGPLSGSVYATVEGDTRFDIELVRR